MVIRKTAKSALVVGAMAMAFTASAQLASASIIYQDYFSRAAPIGSTTPAPYDNYAGTPTWSADGGFNTLPLVGVGANSGEVWMGNSASGIGGTKETYANLPYSSPGAVELSATFTNDTTTQTGASSWMGLGFLSAAGVLSTYGGPWVQLSTNGSSNSLSFYAGSGTSKFVGTMATTFDTAYQLAIILTPIGGGGATANFLVNGTSEATYSYVTAPTIADVGMTQFMKTDPAGDTITMNGFGNNFELVTVVPEPTSLGLLALGCIGLGLLTLKRRRA